MTHFFKENVQKIKKNAEKTEYSKNFFVSQSKKNTCWTVFFKNYIYNKLQIKEFVNILFHSDFTFRPLPLNNYFVEYQIVNF